ncbi:hypothetical protein Tco_1339176 [Tanacetum coccineum]
MEQKLKNLSIMALEISGKNYLSWKLDAETYLDAHDLGDTIQAGTQQYRAKGFTKYCDLISRLLVAEQNNELLMKNHETRPTGVAPLPEVNIANCNYYSGGRGHGYGHGRGRGRGYGRGHGQGRGFGRGNYYGVNHGVQFKDTSGYKKWQDVEKNKNDRDEKEKGVTTDSCYHCGSFDHWAKHYDIPDDHKDQTDATYLDDDEFLTNA